MVFQNMDKNIPSAVSLDLEEEEYLTPLEEAEEAEETQTIQDEITPPPSPPPPPPPPPPPSPLWTTAIMKMHMDRVLAEISRLETIVTQPHIISMKGVQHLVPAPGDHIFNFKWETRVNHLFMEAKIHQFWILDVIPNDNDDDDGYDDDDPDIVHIYVLNHAVKTKIINRLHAYLSAKYENYVIVN